MSEKKQNDFLDLVEGNPDIITDKDLETFLDKTLDIHTQSVFAQVTVVLSFIIALLTLKWFVLDFSSIPSTIATALSFSILALLVYIVLTIRKLKPLETQRKIMEQYLEAKKRLKELKHTNR